jgi:flavin reductase (DIM6/NTAB) family NADH-FMN oxidoreductase RutF
MLSDISKIKGASKGMDIQPNSQNWRTIYKLMIGSILPRPIGWISTISPEGQANLAPFSFSNAVCSNPAHVLFCPSVRATDTNPKDTFNNVLATGEFVVNVVTEELAESMNITATEFPPEVNEFEQAGLTAVPSEIVRPPRVGESPVNFECKVAQIIELGREPGGGSVVIGKVVHLHVADEVLFENDKVDLNVLKPIGRLAGAAYCRVTDIFDITRLPSQIQRS